jgi:chromosome segregation ATPase
MVKKRIEDLLREEAQKSSEPEDGTIIDITPEPDLEPEATDLAATGNSRRTNQTKAELETTVKELKEALEATQEENNSLQQKMTSLQSDLQEQKALVEKLQAELAEAKKVILQLSELNVKPTKNTALATFSRPSIQSSLPSTAFSDTDIGWVD